MRHKVITFCGFFDHVPPPMVIDDTNPADVDHTGDSSTPTDGQLIPDYRQLGFRVPAVVVSNLALPQVVNDGPFEHTSTLKLIESAFGLQPLTARDTHALDLGLVLRDGPRRHPTDPGTVPTSSQVPGPDSGAAAVCSAASVQSVSPAPVRHHREPAGDATAVLPRSGFPSGSGMAELGRRRREDKNG